MRNQVGMQWLLPIGLGAAAMFLLDPAAGGARRARLRDKGVRAARRSREGLGAAGRDLSNRMRGLASRMTSAHDEYTDDDVIVDRVRAAIGRVVSHPGAINVSCQAGVVTLMGPIFREEAARALRAAQATRGVSRVADLLTRHDEPGSVPALQGGRTVQSRRLRALRPTAWSPTARLLLLGAAAATGVAAGVRVLSRDDLAFEFDDETWVLAE